MLFHPKFQTEKERRLIFVDGAPATGPGEDAAPAAEVTEAQKKQANEVIEMLKKNPDMAASLVEFNVEEAAKDAKQFQEAYRAALEKAANAFYKSLTEGTEDKKVARVNAAFTGVFAFTGARSPVNFKSEAGKMVIAAGAPEEKGKPKLSDAMQNFSNAFDRFKVGYSPEAVRRIQGELKNRKVDESKFPLMSDLNDAFEQLSADEKIKVARPDGPLKEINDNLKPLGLHIIFDGKLLAFRGLDEKGQLKLSPEDETRIQNIVKLMPADLRIGGERVLREMLSDPKARAIAMKFSVAVNKLSPDAKKYFVQNAGAILSGGKLDAVQHGKGVSPFMKKVGLEPIKATPQIRQEIEDFKKNAGPDGLALARKIMEQVQRGSMEAGKELSDDERQNIVDGAKKELQKFDVSKASEIDKNIMLARLQMRGIDTSAGEEILKHPDQMKTFEGSPMERGFNQIMGLITLVLLYIRKMKDMFKPKEKKSPETPAEDKNKKGSEALSPEKDAMRQRLKEQAKNEGKSMAQIHVEKQGRLDGLKKKTLPELRNKIQEIHDANEEAGQKDEDNPELQENKVNLQKTEAEVAGLQSEVGELDAMKGEAAALSNTLNQNKKLLTELLAGLPAGEKKARLVSALAFDVEPTEQYQLRIKPVSGVGAAFKEHLNAALSSWLASALSEKIHFDGEDVLKTPAELTQVLQDLTQNVRTELQNKDKPTPAVASAPAGAPPAAPASPATPKS